MTSTAAPARRRGLLVGLGVAGILYVLLLLLAPELLNDPDSYWHVTVGRDILASGSLPTSDSYSFTALGEPWIAKEWLSQVLFATAFESGGWNGVVVLTAAAAAAAFGLLGSFLAQRLQDTPTVVLLGVAFVLAAPHLLARPHVLAMPLMVLWVAGLVGATDRGTAPPWWLLLVMVLWVNLHGTFLVGLALAFALGVDAVVSKAAEAHIVLTRRWASFVGLSVAAALVTPYGPRTIQAGVDVLRLGQGLEVITEWRPPDFSILGPFELVLLGAVGLALVSGFRLPWPRVLILLGLLHLGLSARRNGDVLGLLAPMLLAGPMALHRDRRPRPAGPRRVAITAAIMAVVALPATIAALQRSGVAPSEVATPVAAVEVVSSLGADRVLNEYDFGGYLIQQGVPTFIDGRAELHGAEALVLHDRALRLAPPAALESLLESHEIGATMLRPGTPALAYLDATDAWQRVHADDVAVVHVRAGTPSD